MGVDHWAHWAISVQHWSVCWSLEEVWGSGQDHLLQVLYRGEGLQEVEIHGRGESVQKHKNKSREQDQKRVQKCLHRPHISVLKDKEIQVHQCKQVKEPCTERVPRLFVQQQCVNPRRNPWKDICRVHWKMHKTHQRSHDVCILQRGGEEKVEGGDEIWKIVYAELHQHWKWVVGVEVGAEVGKDQSVFKQGKIVGYGVLVYEVENICSAIYGVFQSDEEEFIHVQRSIYLVDSVDPEWDSGQNRWKASILVQREEGFSGYSGWNYKQKLIENEKLQSWSNSKLNSAHHLWMQPQWNKNYWALNRQRGNYINFHAIHRVPECESQL